MAQPATRARGRPRHVVARLLLALGLAASALALSTGRADGVGGCTPAGPPLVVGMQFQLAEKRLLSKEWRACDGDTPLKTDVAFDPESPPPGPSPESVLAVAQSDPAASLDQVAPQTVQTITLTLGVAVPDLVDQSRSAAEEALSTLGLAASVTPDGADTDAPVLDQDPKPGDLLRFGGTVALDVQPPEPVQVTVPNVVDRTLDEAESLLTAARLVPELAGTTLEGRVASQDPAADTQVPEGSTVTLTLVVVPGQVAVPDLRRLSEEDAADALTGQGLVLGSVTGGFGTVSSQAPSAGALVDQGTEVDVTLTSSDLVLVPDLGGLSPSAARDALALVGLPLDAVPADAGDALLARGQDPDAGSLASPGTTVEVQFVGATVPGGGENTAGTDWRTVAATVVALLLVLGTAALALRSFRGRRPAPPATPPDVHVEPQPPSAPRVTLAEDDPDTATDVREATHTIRVERHPRDHVVTVTVDEEAHR